MIGQSASRALKLGWMLACAGGAEAWAQETVTPNEADLAAASAPANGVIAYTPSFFAEFRPSTAQDMINRIPGFSYNKGDEVRGFGGA